MPALLSLISTSCAGLAALAFLFGAQARFTDRITPNLYLEQHQKTLESQAVIYNTLGISAKTATILIGVVNIFIAGGLLYAPVRRLTAVLTILYMGIFGLRGRWLTGRSVRSPLAVMIILVGAMVQDK